MRTLYISTIEFDKEPIDLVGDPGKQRVPWIQQGSTDPQIVIIEPDEKLAEEMIQIIPYSTKTRGQKTTILSSSTCCIQWSQENKKLADKVLMVAGRAAFDRYVSERWEFAT